MNLNKEQDKALRSDMRNRATVGFVVFVLMTSIAILNKPLSSYGLFDDLLLVAFIILLGWLLAPSLRSSEHKDSSDSKSLIAGQALKRTLRSFKRLLRPAGPNKF